MWGREDGHQLLVGKEFVAVLNDLMGSRDEIYSELFESVLDGVGTEDVADTASAFFPSGGSNVGVTPEQIEM